MQSIIDASSNLLYSEETFVVAVCVGIKVTYAVLEARSCTGVNLGERRGNERERRPERRERGAVFSARALF